MHKAYYYHKIPAMQAPKMLIDDIDAISHTAD